MSGGPAVPAGLRDQLHSWLADEVDDTAAHELQLLLDAADVPALQERFAGPLAFGTAGLRGALRAGPNGMNTVVVRRAAAGLAHWLDARNTAAPNQVVVVGYDARHGSAGFARDSAAVFAAAGLDARLLPGPLPTPVLAFAVQRLGAVAGVMVTASHNPATDNGYKVYVSDGAQLAPPLDVEIEAAIHAVGATREIALDPDAVTLLDDALVRDYIDAVVALVPQHAAEPRADLRIVHTAMHGVGSDTVRAVFAAAGFDDVHSVGQQQAPDPDFPTVAFPNPEEPGALDLSFALARNVDADLVIASDPDADRCAVAVPDAGAASGWRRLHGDEVGVLLADAMMAEGIRGTYATTIVSSQMLGALAHRRGVAYAETLTGFKWIARAAPDLVYGYEEAMGYAVAPELVRDKDGISAGLRVALLAARLRLEGSSLLGRLDELAGEVGRFVTDQVSIRVDGPAQLADLMDRLRAARTVRLRGRDVSTQDLAPAADVLRWQWDGGRVVIRPSGTEPKLKAYLEVSKPDGSAERAGAELSRLRIEVEALLR